MTIRIPNTGNLIQEVIEDFIVRERRNYFNPIDSRNRFSEKERERLNYLKKKTFATISGKKFQKFEDKYIIPYYDNILIDIRSNTLVLLLSSIYAKFGYAKVLNWVSSQTLKLTHLLSICTGALLLAKLNLFDGLHATTHHGSTTCS